MHTVVIIGASGVVGRRALAHFLAHPAVERVVALGRRPLSFQHERLVSRVVDLASEARMAQEIPPEVSVAVSCLGTTMKQAGSKAAFRAVDHDAVLAFARAARSRGARRFVLVSSIGASPHARTFYLKTKGELEAALEHVGYPELSVLRPSFIDDQGTRAEHRIGERIALPLARAAFSLIGPRRRHAPITADAIGKALVRLSLDETREPVRIVESDRLHALGA